MTPSPHCSIEGRERSPSSFFRNGLASKSPNKRLVDACGANRSSQLPSRLVKPTCRIGTKAQPNRGGRRGRDGWDSGEPMEGEEDGERGGIAHRREDRARTASGRALEGEERGGGRGNDPSGREQGQVGLARSRKRERKAAGRERWGRDGRGAREIRAEGDRLGRESPTQGGSPAQGEGGTGTRGTRFKRVRRAMFRFNYKIRPGTPGTR